MAGLPFLGLVTAVVLILLTIYLFLKGTVGFRTFLLLEAVLALFILAIVFPQSIDFLMSLLDVGVRGLFVLTVGVLGAYLLLYGLYTAQARQEKMLIESIQEISLLRYRIEFGDAMDENNVHAPREAPS